MSREALLAFTQQLLQEKDAERQRADQAESRCACDYCMYTTNPTLLLLLGRLHAQEPVRARAAQMVPPPCPFPGKDDKDEDWKIAPLQWVLGCFDPGETNDNIAKGRRVLYNWLQVCKGGLFFAASDLLSTYRQSDEIQLLGVIGILAFLRTGLTRNVHRRSKNGCWKR